MKGRIEHRYFESNDTPLAARIEEVYHVDGTWFTNMEEVKTYITFLATLPETISVEWQDK